MQCLTDLGGGNYTVIVPQPASTSTCTIMEVTLTELQTSPWALSTADAVTIGVSIASLWGIAYAYRLIAGFLKSNNGGSENEV